MKQILTMTILLVSIFLLPLLPIFSENEKCGHHRYDSPCRREHKGEFLQQRIKKLKEEGVITAEEEKEILDAVNDLKSYREEIWKDDKLTKQEQETLKQKEKLVRDKIKQILQKVQQHFEQEKTPQEREEILNKRIDKAVNEGKISKKEADELKKLNKDLTDLEQKIWSDGVMTKDEHKKLIEKKEEFNKKMRDVFKLIYKKKYKKKFEKGCIDEIYPHHRADKFSPNYTKEKI
ncbi:MAG: hypothetical protein NZ839_03010 [Endomicrobia bacterium]|nr:hypothetical protein [Endomicrobiia bacterium]